ncbi:MAG: tetratricopeptide repeat protein [Bacteroidales bacterium]|nr:tetratricopeptide repeat protein [Bacteroidales bacterium]
MKMNRILIAIIAFVCMANVRAEIVNPATLVAEAAYAYDQGNYAEAAQKYEALVDVFNGAPDLYYGLGNAYFKQQEYTRAILNYERCLRRDPSNDDARANLELARLNCIDKIESIQPIIFVTWSNALRDVFSADAWGRLSIITFVLFLAGFACYFFVRKVAIRKTGFYGGIVMIVICAICMFYANAQAEIQTAHDHAIVMAPTVTLRSTPADSGTQLLVIHAGLKVRVRQELSGWSEVELSDGNVGWMPTEQLEVI